MSKDSTLGSYLKDRRAKIGPPAYGIESKRRRTPGLRREEVAQRANVSATWYTWLEQGRGGAPSAAVLDRIAAALELTRPEREHLFLLAQNRPPKVQRLESEDVTPRLQRVLDSFEFIPAIIKTALWDVVAWNAAATAILTDYGALPPGQRNILRILFCEPRVREGLLNWEDYARFAVGAFRSHAFRAGASDGVDALVEELSNASAAFKAIWQDYAIRDYGEGTKTFHHPIAGLLTLDHSAYGVDGRPDLSLVIFTPATATDSVKIKSAIAKRSAC